VWSSWNICDENFILRIFRHKSSYSPVLIHSSLERMEMKNVFNFFHSKWDKILTFSLIPKHYLMMRKTFRDKFHFLACYWLVWKFFKILTNTNNVCTWASMAKSWIWWFHVISSKEKGNRTKKKKLGNEVEKEKKNEQWPRRIVCRWAWNVNLIFSQKSIMKKKKEITSLIPNWKVVEKEDTRVIMYKESFKT
jgi:hypothetical protein